MDKTAHLRMSRAWTASLAALALALTAPLLTAQEEAAGSAAEAAPDIAPPTDEPTETTAMPSTEDAAIAAVKAYIQENKDAGRIDTGKDGWRTNLPKFPGVTFTQGATYTWHLKTNMGPMKLRFLPETAPEHVANFIYLSELGFFDSLLFHRVIPGFMAQGGCPLGKGTGGPGYRFAGEFDPSVKHDRGGLLSMANAGPNTDGSQFFITFTATPWLDGNHTIFGELVEGESTLRELEKRGTRGKGWTTEALRIEEARVTVE
jgi:cyclophilin family peptidyl-prolyl cis-trans isomerase